MADTRTVVIRYAIAVLPVALVTLILAPFQKHINSTTIALGLLLLVLFVAILRGSGPALVASVLAMLCFNFFFLPPLYTLNIADAQNWAALIAFFITAVAVGQLSGRARQRASEAEAARLEIKRLFDELQEAFERASDAEALKRSEKLKSALLDAVTHDLRTPLTSIKASVTTLLEKTEVLDDSMVIDAEGRQELLEVINEESDRLNRFIESMVDLARIEAGEMTLRRTWGVVDEIIGAAVTRARPLTKQNHVRIAIESDLPAIRADPRALAEVVFALLDNAAKYSPKGSNIVVTASRAPSDAIKIAVQDEGPGIPVEMRGRVFDKFFRVSGEDHSTNATGVGMGLAIARGIVEAHEGRIWIDDSKQGEGLRIAFTIPTGDEDFRQPFPGEQSLVSEARGEL